LSKIFVAPLGSPRRSLGARFIEPPGPQVSAPLRAESRWKLQTLRGGFKEWKLVQWPTTPLPRGPRRPRMKINKKLALQLPKQDFYSFKLCTADNVEALLVSGRRDILAHVRHCRHSAHTMCGLEQKKSPR